MFVSIENAIIKLINNDEFYAHLLMNMKISASKSIPTLGVGIVDNSLSLLYNEEFFNSFNLEAQCLLLQHECAHVMLGHLIDRAQRVKPEHRMIKNIAEDAAIHEILTNIKKIKKLQPVTVEGFNKQWLNEKFLPNKNNEYYFEKLLQIKDAQSKQQTHDVHDLEPGDVDVAKQATMKALENAKQAAGKIPAEAELTLEKLRKSAVNWTAALRRYIGSNTSVNKRTSRSRSNRRYGLDVAGSRKSFSPNIAVIVDTSGSMFGEPLEVVWAELAKLDRLDYNITIIEADAAVSRKPYKFKKTLPNFKGGGGTAYQPGIDAALRLHPDLIIYMGDMDAADNPTCPKMPFLWLITGNSNPPANFGSIIRVPV